MLDLEDFYVVMDLAINMLEDERRHVTERFRAE
jgi:hypothetical protein